MNLNEMDKRSKTLDRLAAAAFPSKRVKAKLNKAGKKARNLAREGVSKEKARDIIFGQFYEKPQHLRAERRDDARLRRADKKEKGIGVKRGTGLKEENSMTLKEYYKKVLTETLKEETAVGKVASTPEEKKLASFHGDKKRITRGDIIKAAISKKK